MGRGKRGARFRWDEVCVVHTVQRCVRRAFLAGVDEKTGVDYSPRKQWIRRRLEALASVFGIDVLNYAILSNHLHLVLRNRPDVVNRWADEELALRWLRVFPGRRMEEHLAEPTKEAVQSLVSQRKRMKEIRKRMSDISWFMRSVAEPIARMANKQDDCTGRFWEGRFKAQRILDEASLLTCAMYVDLNPIRAAIAETVEGYVHTSAFDRLEGAKGTTVASVAFDLIPITAEAAGKTTKSTPVEELRKRKASGKPAQDRKQVLRDAWLSPLSLNPKVLAADPEVHHEGVRASDKGYLEMSQADYLKLLRWTATLGKDGAVSSKAPEHLQELLTQLGIEPSMWRDLVYNFKHYFGRSSSAGSPAAMAEDAKRSGLHWHHGQQRSRACFSQSV